VRLIAGSRVPIEVMRDLIGAKLSLIAGRRWLIRPRRWLIALLACLIASGGP